MENKIGEAFDIAVKFGMNVTESEANIFKMLLKQIAIEAIYESKSEIDTLLFNKYNELKDN